MVFLQLILKRYMKPKGETLSGSRLEGLRLSSWPLRKLDCLESFRETDKFMKWPDPVSPISVGYIKESKMRKFRNFDGYWSH